jgi:hypothetical protein
MIHDAQMCASGLSELMDARVGREVVQSDTRTKRPHNSQRLCRIRVARDIFTHVKVRSG